MEKQSGSAAAPKIVLATVKGDVHDIGKNIVGVVLACNGYAIVDLGVMVPAEQIVETAEKESAAMIGLSALISPSLDEMVNVAREMEKRRMKIPLLIGGAAASLAYTALRIVPEYAGPVVYVPDAGRSAETVRYLLSETERPRFLEENAGICREAVRRHETIQSRVEILPLEKARANRVPRASHAPAAPKTTGIIELNDYPLDRVIPRIDWPAFLRGWEAQKAADTLPEDAKDLLERIKTEKLLTLRGVMGIFPAASDGDDIVVFKDGAERRFCMLRSQEKKRAGAFNPCLADFIAPRAAGQNSPSDWLGLFALSAGFGMKENVRVYQDRRDDYGAILLESLANALTEAFAEEIHLRICGEWWGCAAGVRPAFGYPANPDHEDKRIAFDLLEAEQRCGLELTGSAMMIPAASVCGMFFASSASCYFGVGAIGEDQLTDWARRKNIDAEEARRRMGINNLALS
jgi:5-methyltetrahydrofolate--homocysteine methyltransferase